jgi:3-methyl-2-oxobutanoate hydroxymethyltransferase
MTYYNTDLALENAARFIQEGEAQAVKIEGGERVADIVRRIVEWGIPVMGHIGLTPQSILAMGGYKIQGKTPDAAKKLLNDARALEEAGAFSIVLEVVPSPLARLITQRLKVPTIGIGAGPFCDGQVQVISDILGLFPDFTPKHAKKYANMLEVMENAIKSYVSEVGEGTFPTQAQGFPLDEEILSGL